MGAEKSFEPKVNSELSKAFEERGALYSLHYLVSGDDKGELKVFK